MSLSTSEIFRLTGESPSARLIGSACTHEKAETIGVTDWGLAHTNIEWCPRCGAWRRRMLNWAYQVGEWNLPNDRGQR
jgi:hypothetical protein